jgi:hypothetical protein
MIIDAGTASYNSFRAIIKTVHVEAGILFTLRWKPRSPSTVMRCGA